MNPRHINAAHFGDSLGPAALFDDLRRQTGHDAIIAEVATTVNAINASANVCAFRNNGGMDDLTWIKDGLRKPGKSQAGIARALGRDPAAVSRLLKDLRTLKASEVSKIRDYLDADEPEPSNVKPASGEPPSATEKDDMPVYGYAAGSEEDVFFVDQGGPHVIRTARPNVLRHASEAYAVDVFGESMSNKYEPGNRLWVYPKRPVRPGDDVVVQFRDGRAMVKRLVRRTEEYIVVRQFNPAKELRLKKADVKSLDLVVGMLTVLT